MRVLIAENNADMAQVWARHLERQSADVTVTHDHDSAIAALTAEDFDAIVLNLSLGARGDAMAVSDYAAYRQPRTKVIFVTASSFFSDGSIFALCPNACACLPEQTDPADLAALVEYHTA